MSGGNGASHAVLCIASLLDDFSRGVQVSHSIICIINVRQATGKSR